MMKMNAAVWIAIAGGMIGFLAGIFAVLTTAGSSGPYIALGMVALFGGMGLLFWKLIFGPMVNAGRLSKHGIPGKAVIKEVKDTGVTINNNPQVKLTLEVKNNLGQRYTTTCRTLVSRINPFVYQPGMEVPVKIDPKNEQNVIIDWSVENKNASNTTTTFGQPNIPALTSELEQMQKDNDALLQTGRPARAIIKKYTWLGANVNGNNPYVELEVEVLPENTSSFSGKARGVISKASINKYQPGCEIFVKYDFYDNSKVVIERSK